MSQHPEKRAVQIVLNVLAGLAAGFALAMLLTGCARTATLAEYRDNSGATRTTTIRKSGLPFGGTTFTEIIKAPYGHGTRTNITHYPYDGIRR